MRSLSAFGRERQALRQGNLQITSFDGVADIAIVANIYGGGQLVITLLCNPSAANGKRSWGIDRFHLDGRQLKLKEGWRCAGGVAPQFFRISIWIECRIVRRESSKGIACSITRPDDPEFPSRRINADTRESKEYRFCDGRGAHDHHRLRDGTFAVDIPIKIGRKRVDQATRRQIKRIEGPDI